MNYNCIIMEYQKIINILDNTTNVPTKFRTKNWVEINDKSRGMYNTNSQIRFKTLMLRSRLCTYSDANILFKGTIAVTNTAATGKAANNANENVTFKNFVSFTSFISRVNNMQIDDAQYINVVMPMYNLIEYSDNYSKIFGVLWQYCGYLPTLDDDGAIIDFTEVNAVTGLFYLKLKLTSQTDNNGTKNVLILVPLKYLNNFCRTLVMPLINCELTLELCWSENCVIVATNVAAQATTFFITDTKSYTPIVIL